MNPAEELVKLRRQVEELKRKLAKNMVVSPAEPADPFNGQFWMNPLTPTLKIRNGNDWKTITLT